MIERNCIPNASILIESMRSIGYSFPTAIADLIDNSISAHASLVELYSMPNDDPFLLIIDNGKGMDKYELFEAMRFGSINPLEEREKDDLGRFGLGLKSASLSQCRKFVVVSKKDGCINACSWDLDYINKTGEWTLKIYLEEEILKLPMIDILLNMDSGSYIELLNFDRIKETSGNNKFLDTFNKNIDMMLDHLSLVFHRYISNGLTICFNKNKIEARDPFLSNHTATQKLRKVSFDINGEEITLQPYILPYQNKLSPSDLEQVGGVEQLRSNQGFYIYRNKRLITWGTWFNLERKSELSKLARVMVDIPNTLDYMWSIDIKKSTATLPDIIKKEMFSAVLSSVEGSEKIHVYRGRREKKNVEYVWERIKIRDSYEYQINRNLPQLELLQKYLDDKGKKILNSLLITVESSFPFMSLYVDVGKGKIDNRKETEEKDYTDNLWSELQEQIDYVREKNLSVKKYYELLKKTEPYCYSKQIVNRIDEELKKYE